jgi:hypothetical protein
MGFLTEIFYIDLPEVKDIALVFHQPVLFA